MRAKTSRTLKTEYTFNRYIKKYEPSSPVAKAYRLLWTDCVEFEIVQVPVSWSTSAAVVYCSTRVLSQKEKENFFWYHKNDFAHVQYFQYSDEAVFQEFLHCVPERARNYLEAKALVLGLPGE